MVNKEIMIKDELINEDRLQRAVDRVSNKYRGNCTEFIEVGEIPAEFNSKKYDKIESKSTISDDSMVKILDEI